MDSGKNDLQELRRLCREGMLFEVQEWIRSGKAVSPGKDAKASPLTLAAGQGFHSLVTLLLAHGEPPVQALLDTALAAAVHGGNCETARLLLARGATFAVVDRRAIFNASNVEILSVCTEAGVDLAAETPLGCELICHSETALRFLERWHAESDLVADQGAMALITAVRRSDEWWVKSLLRAGADQRREVPGLGDRYEVMSLTTALEEGAKSATFRVLLLLGVRKTDDFDALFRAACWDFDFAKIKHLVRRKGRVNDKNGGCSVLQLCLRNMGMWHHLSNAARARKAWAAAVQLTGMGARWEPDADELRDVRCGLRHAGTDDWVEVAAVLLKAGAADHVTLARLFGTPAMRERLAGYGQDEMEKVLGAKWWQPRRGRRRAAGCGGWDVRTQMCRGSGRTDRA